VNKEEKKMVSIYTVEERLSKIEEDYEDIQEASNKIHLYEARMEREVKRMEKEFNNRMDVFISKYNIKIDSVNQIINRFYQKEKENNIVKSSITNYKKAQLKKAIVSLIDEL
jgi:hypothetical protein